MVFNKRCIQTVTEQCCPTGRVDLYSSLFLEAGIRLLEAAIIVDE